MSSIIISIIGALLLVFLDTVFSTAGLISISAILVVFLYERMSTLSYVVLISLFSIIVDSYFGFFIGTHLVVFLVIITLYTLLKAVLPYERPLTRGLTLLVTFMGFHILMHVAITLQLGGVSEIQITSMVESAVVRGVIESLLFSILIFVATNYFGNNMSAVKVKI